MPKFRAPPALQQFVENELLRMPIVLESSVQPTLDSLQRAMAQAIGAQRQVLGEVILRLSSQRARVVERYIGSLREQTTGEMLGATPRTAESPKASGLSLVDDDEVAIDVVVSHAIETIRSIAEHELRELLAFTSALVGDMDVAADYNPLRAETQARALWAAAGALPLSRAHQVAFVRHAATPMAQALRKAYSAACARLEDQGVEPAAYRTVIPPAGSRTQRSQFDGGFGSVAPTGVTATGATGSAAAARTAGPATTGASGAAWAAAGADASSPARPQSSATPPGPARADVPDTRVIERITRLFAHLLADRSLPTELHAAISRVQGLVVQAAAADATVLDQPELPLWRFVDLMAHLSVVDPGPEGEQVEALVAFVGKLADQVAAEPRQTLQLHDWAFQQLQRFAAARLAARTSAARVQIEQMHQLEQRLAASDGPFSTFHGALDAAHLDTVPADLIDQDSPAPEDSSRWLLSLHSGDWLRLFRKGAWRDCQLLWAGDRGELWLFVDEGSDEPWAMRRSALQLLREERLADVQKPRPRVHAAMAATALRRS